MDILVKQVREHLLLACFFPNELPKLEKQQECTYAHEEQDGCTPTEMYDQMYAYNYECPVCKEITQFSDASMLSDDRYRELCLTDTCVKKQIQTFIKDNKYDTDL